MLTMLPVATLRVRDLCPYIRHPLFRFMFLRSTEDTIHGKKGGDSGVCICKTKQAIIIGTYADGKVAGTCSATVSKLMDYLVNMNY